MPYIIVNTIEIKNGNPHSFVNPTASELDVFNKKNYTFSNTNDT